MSYGALREYFLGSELDATMHYPFRTAVLDFLQGKINAQTACDTFWTIQEHYPKENLYAALNLIGSHDRARVLTVLGGDKGRETARFTLRAGEGLQIPLGQFHTVEVKEPTILFESKDGAYAPAAPEDIIEKQP